jgi:signal transduction histidine kinase
MSHEIRTPMNAIMGFTYLLRRAAPTEVQAKRLDIIAEAAGHLLAVLNDVLDLAKIESGKIELAHTSFSLQAVLEETLSLISIEAEAKGLAVEADSGGLPDLVWGDPTRVRQALLNYASNAVKFTHHGRIVLRAVRAQGSPDAQLVRFEVEDTGIGIASDIQARLFKAFEQADASITRQYGGTGLGLTITSRLAQLMGGEAGVDSQPGKGSTFWFTCRLVHEQGLSGERQRAA